MKNKTNFVQIAEENSGVDFFKFKMKKSQDFLKNFAKQIKKVSKYSMILLFATFAYCQLINQTQILLNYSKRPTAQALSLKSMYTRFNTSILENKATLIDEKIAADAVQKIVLLNKIRANKKNILFKMILSSTQIGFLKIKRLAGFIKSTTLFYKSFLDLVTKSVLPRAVTVGQKVGTILDNRKYLILIFCLKLKKPIKKIMRALLTLGNTEEKAKAHHYYYIQLTVLLILFQKTVGESLSIFMDMLSFLLEFLFGSNHVMFLYFLKNIKILSSLIYFLLFALVHYTAVRAITKNEFPKMPKILRWLNKNVEYFCKIKPKKKYFYK